MSSQYFVELSSPSQKFGVDSHLAASYIVPSIILKNLYGGFERNNELERMPFKNGIHQAAHMMQ